MGLYAVRAGRESVGSDEEADEYEDATDDDGETTNPHFVDVDEALGAVEL
ncbi:MAG TPA: hypothetical protein VLZ05_06610 [Mycobacterium sp.]|nr:hypothetical protein [Mycobacterium sp.]HUH68572.1 hypothetical protein [Mycobacterium sp.]